ncbi:MAG: type I methionyl aminopeptidase [Patescibacteria group bacterium]
MSGITLKTPEEIEALAEGGRILAQALQKVAQAAKPGVSTWELNRIAEEEIERAGAEPSFKGYGEHGKVFPASLCTSVNDVIVHGAPSTGDILREGDVVGLDLGVKYKGFFSDGAITVGVGKISEEAERLLAVGRRALDLAIAQARVGKRIGDISSAIQSTAEAAGFGVVRELIGHGVGYAVHEDPAVPCFGRKGEGVLLEEGMVLAIEPMLTMGGYPLTTMPDGWGMKTKDGSLTVHFEHTVAITKNGPRILTGI